MIGRIVSAVLVLWALGFIWFTIALPQPARDMQTDAVIVPTGAAGRIERGLEVLEEGRAEALLVTGVDREVKAPEFAEQFNVSPGTMDCCVTLGFAAVDTRSNAAETAQWVKDRDVGSLRLVTTDWHMRRAAGELTRALPGGVTVVRDAVPSEPSLHILFLEYHKLLASVATGLFE